MTQTTKFALRLPGAPPPGMGHPPGLAGTPAPPPQMVPGTAPTPAFAAPPKPAAPGPFDGIHGGIKGMAAGLASADPVGWARRGLADAGQTAKFHLTSAATRSTPPLAHMFPETFGSGSTLGGLASGAQRMFKGNPGLFAGALGGLAGPVVQPLLGTSFGLPLMAGLYGMTAGGESAAAAQQLFGPALKRLGLGG